MGNMGYCRFENTLRDLLDCIEYLHDKGLSDSEEKARTELIEKCIVIALDSGEVEEV